jgi:hypothetical protein
MHVQDNVAIHTLTPHPGADEQAKALQMLYDAARRFCLEWDLEPWNQMPRTEPWAPSGPFSVPVFDSADALLVAAGVAEQRVVGVN